MFEDRGKNYFGLGRYDVSRWVIEFFAHCENEEEVNDWTVQFFLICNALFFSTDSDKMSSNDYLM